MVKTENAGSEVHSLQSTDFGYELNPGYKVEPWPVDSCRLIRARRAQVSGIADFDVSCFANLLDYPESIPVSAITQETEGGFFEDLVGTSYAGYPSAFTERPARFLAETQVNNLREQSLGA